MVKRVLCYTTDIGKVAIVRQLKPGIHLESKSRPSLFRSAGGPVYITTLCAAGDPSMCAKLNPHIRAVVHVRQPPEGETPSVKWAEAARLADLSMS